MNSHPKRSENASAYARAALRCREVREDVVALQRGDLSPLRAESVRQHLVSCPECREEALELEVAVRSFAGLPELVPPRDLAARAWRRVFEASRRAGLLASGSPPAARTADREPDVPAGPLASGSAGARLKAGRAGPPPEEPSQDRALGSGSPEAREPAAASLRGSAADVAESGGAPRQEAGLQRSGDYKQRPRQPPLTTKRIVGMRDPESAPPARAVITSTPPGSETRETKILRAVRAPAHGVLFRPVRSPLIRLAVAAVLLLGVITYSVFELDYTVWRIQSQLLGPRYSEAIQRAAEALTKLWL